MIALDTGADPARSQRPRVTKTTRPKPEEKTKIGLYISQESARRLGITATMEGLDRSTIVDRLIRDHCRKQRSAKELKLPEKSSGCNPFGCNSCVIVSP